MEISFNTFKARSSSRVNKLTLEKDEQFRVCFIEPRPQLIYVHTFEKVMAGDDGRPAMTEVTWSDGSTQERPKTSYEGKFRCLGNAEEVQRTGSDPENCPACRGHISNSNAIKPPTPRILANVLKYATKPGSFTPTKPFSAELLVWDLTEKRFAKLQALWEEHGDLNKKDLLLGPCTNKQMQTYDMAIASGDAVYLQSEPNQEYLKELLNESYNKDLADAAGKLPSEFEMQTKVNEIIRTYDHVFGTGGNSSSFGSLLEGMNSSASSPASPATPVEAAAPPAPTPAPTSPKQEEPEEEPEAAPKVTEENATSSLDDLLASIK